MRAPMGSVMFLAFLLAAMTPDVVDAVYFLASFCSPFGLYSHTLPAVILEAAVVGAAALLITGSRSLALWFLLIVLLHAPADYLTGYKLVLPGGELHGLDIYRKPPLDTVLEVPIILIGWWLLKRRGGVPPWMMSGWGVSLIVILQIAFGLQFGLHKPSGCVTTTRMEQRVALVVQR